MNRDKNHDEIEFYQGNSMNDIWYDVFSHILWGASLPLGHLCDCGKSLLGPMPWYVVYIQSNMITESYFDGLVQDHSNSIANALELLQSCTKTSNIFFQVIP